MAKISIVILNWNRAEDTIACISSVKKLRLNGNKLEIVIVDNGSKKEVVRKINNVVKKSNNVIHLINKWNLGFAEGNNVGIRHSLDNGSDYVMVLNNDTVVDRDLLANMLPEFEKDDKIGIISPLIYFAPGFEFHRQNYGKSVRGRVVWYAGGHMDWKNIYGSNRGVDEVDVGQYAGVTETDFATGACMLVKREVLEKVGMFDEKYFMYLEDVDFSMRAKRVGYKVRYFGGAHIWHKVAQSSAIGGELNDYFISRNRMLFGIKYAKSRTKFALVRESAKLLLFGRKWQKKGIADFYLGKFKKGSWK